MGNPFKETSQDLFVLDTGDIADTNVAVTIKTVDQIGEQQYTSYVKERLAERTKPIIEVIKKNKLALFRNPRETRSSKQKQSMMSLKQNCSLFSQLYVSCQVRRGNLDDFFSHENQSYPPSISSFGNLRSGAKSDLLKIVEKLYTTQVVTAPVVEATLIDGAAIVNMLKPNGACKTFSDYANQVYLPYIRSQLHKVKRLDMVWDRYIDNSLKCTTRSNRGKGVRRKVKFDAKLPGDWASFLRVDDNKTELFQYLGHQTVSIEIQGKQIMSTSDKTVLCDSRESLSSISPCTHEEADTRLILHAFDAGKEGFKKVMLRTVDTDVVVLAITFFSRLSLDELWIAFGSGKNFRYIAVHEIAASLGEENCQALGFFHSFTGCDQTSAFTGKGKSTAWATWLAYREVTTAFNRLGETPSEECVLANMPLIERFVVLMYDRTSACLNVNDARKALFTQKGRSLDNIPSTSSALLQHTKRAVYQGGYCWNRSLEPMS